MRWIAKPKFRMLSDFLPPVTYPRPKMFEYQSRLRLIEALNSDAKSQSPKKFTDKSLRFSICYDLAQTNFMAPCSTTLPTRQMESNRFNLCCREKHLMNRVLVEQYKPASSIFPCPRRAPEQPLFPDIEWSAGGFFQYVAISSYLSPIRIA